MSHLAARAARHHLSLRAFDLSERKSEPKKSCHERIPPALLKARFCDDVAVGERGNPKLRKSAHVKALRKRQPKQQPRSEPEGAQKRISLPARSVVSGNQHSSIHD